MHHAGLNLRNFHPHSFFSQLFGSSSLNFNSDQLLWLSLCGPLFSCCMHMVHIMLGEKFYARCSPSCTEQRRSIKRTWNIRRERAKNIQSCPTTLPPRIKMRMSGFVFSIPRLGHASDMCTWISIILPFKLFDHPLNLFLIHLPRKFSFWASWISQSFPFRFPHRRKIFQVCRRVGGIGNYLLIQIFMSRKWHDILLQMTFNRFAST